MTEELKQCHQGLNKTALIKVLQDCCTGLWSYAYHINCQINVLIGIIRMTLTILTSLGQPKTTPHILAVNLLCRCFCVLHVTN